jgi:hypothetical protein
MVYLDHLLVFRGEESSDGHLLRVLLPRVGVASALAQKL